MFPGLDLCYADPAQPLTTPGEDLNYLDHGSVRGAQRVLANGPSGEELPKVNRCNLIRLGPCTGTV